MKRLTILFLSLLTVLSAAESARAAAKQPVYFQLFARIDDHVNYTYSEDKVTRILPLLERYGAPATFEFNGVVSEIFSERAKSTGLVDLIKAHVQKGRAEVAYNGADEPTPMTRPRPNLRRATTPQDRWLARGEAAEWFLTEFKEPFWGNVDPRRSGGLKRTQEVFGEVAGISGLSPMEMGANAEILHHVRRYNSKAVMSGMPEGSTWPARNIHGFGGSAPGVGDYMSPAPDTSPELYWLENYLHLSDTSHPAVKIIPGSAGPENLRTALEKLDRSRPHVIRVYLVPQDVYLKPDFLKAYGTPARYAYDNPKRPGLLESFLQPQPEVDAAYERQEALVKWISTEFLPANPGSRFVTYTSLKGMARNTHGEPVPQTVLRRATAAMLADWKEIGNYPPSYAATDGQYFSLTDMFQMLANSLAEFHRTGSHSTSVRLTHVYGPADLPSDQGPSLGTVASASLASECARLAPLLNDQTWKPMPDNIIPEWISVDGIRLNAAQFLRLMAEAYMMQAQKLAVKTCQMYPGTALIYPKTVDLADLGGLWTMKPAPLKR